MERGLVGNMIKGKAILGLGLKRTDKKSKWTDQLAEELHKPDWSKPKIEWTKPPITTTFATLKIQTREREMKLRSRDAMRISSDYKSNAERENGEGFSR